MTTDPSTNGSLLDELLAEMQAIIIQYECSDSCARMILASRHSSPSRHTKDFEVTLVALDKFPDPLKTPQT